MDKKAVGRGAIILIVILLVLIGVFLIVLGIAIFGGNKQTIAPGGNEVETPGAGTGSGTGTKTPTQPTNDNSKKAPTEQQPNYIPDDHPGDNVNPNYGRCTPNWPSNAGQYQPGLSETLKSQCTKHIEQNNCLSVDIYRAITDTFGQADGIHDCNWN